MSKKPRTPRPRLRRIVYSVLFWMFVYLVGILVGGALAWAAGANTNIQIGAGLIVGVILMFVANRWVQRYRRGRS